MDSSHRSATEGDLILLAQAFLEERIGYAEFRRLLLETWDDLKRGALSADDRRAWTRIVNAARNTRPESLEVQGPGPLFDQRFFWDALFSLLFGDPDDTRSARSERAREVQASIAGVLLKEWDPIGVQDVPEAHDEYDSYVGEIYHLLASGAEAEAIAARLAHIETTSMGLGRIDPALRLPVARTLLSLDVSLPPRAG